MKLIELQSNEFYYSKLGAISNSVIEFYMKHFSESKSFPKLIDLAKKFVCMFGRTYLIEKLFLEMKHIKRKIQSKLTESHLESSLTLACSNIQANLEKLARLKQHQKSH